MHLAQANEYSLRNTANLMGVATSGWEPLTYMNRCTYLVEDTGCFLRGKATGAWSWPHASIYCRG